MKLEVNPMDQEGSESSESWNFDVERRLANIRGASRCGAKTRRGTLCQCPAIRDRSRCRIHGGLSTGAPRGDRNGNFKDGAWTKEAQAERRWLSTLVKSVL